MCINSTCPNKKCAFYRQKDKGNVRYKTKRRGIYYCNQCRATWTFTKDSFFYNLKTPPKIVIRALLSLARGFGIREVARKERVTTDSIFFWLRRAIKYKNEITQLVIEEIGVGVNGEVDKLWEIVNQKQQLDQLVD